MGIVDIRRLVSRREFLGLGAAVVGAHFAALSIPFLGGKLLRNLRVRGMAQWYEIVQDMKDGDKWHVNLFAAPTLGDLPRAEHLEHRVVRTGEATSLQERQRYPARIQFRDGRKEQTF